MATQEQKTVAFVLYPGLTLLDLVGTPDLEPVVGLYQPGDAGVQSNRQVKGGDIGLQVIGHRVLGRVGVGRGRERHPRQGVVLGRGEQLERVPPGPPDVADLGAGRFLVLSHEGVPEPNLVWKDTVLVRTGQVVDILFDVSNPGLWMAHCHIAEHMQSGMMFSFNVAREAAR